MHDTGPARARHPALPRDAHRSARSLQRRRGGIYIAVLGAGMLVTLIGLTALAGVRIQRITAVTAADAEQARLHAQSAVELGALWIQTDPLWRTVYPNGVWVADMPLGDGVVTIEGFDPIDGNLLERPTNPVILRATATRGRATQIVQARMDSSGPPLNILEVPLYASGGVRIRNMSTVAVDQGPLGTQTLRNDGHISGDAECLVYSGSGTISGTLTIIDLPRDLPASNVFAMYADMGTHIEPGSTIDGALLAPGVNPWGPADPNGVYIIRTNQDLAISRSRIHGTLVIIAPGRTITISSSVLMHSARDNYPTLLIDGNVRLVSTSESPLSESVVGVNFNPPEAPFEGQSNVTLTDVFPSEIRGLVHIRGTMRSEGICRIRGTLIVQDSSTSALDIRDELRVIYNPAILENPPLGYMRHERMDLTPGSWRQVVRP